MKICILFFKILCGIALFLGLQQLIEKKTHGFCIQKILASDLFFQPSWHTPPLDEKEQKEMLSSLDQPYRFLGAGSECFVFLSEDGKTIIKFFKLQPLRPIYFFRGLFIEDHSASAGTLSPLYATSPRLLKPLSKRILGMREYRIDRTLTSLKNAYTFLREETGLLYLHLNPTDSLHKNLLLYDPNGIAHNVDLDTVRFCVQKRTTPCREHLLALKQKEEHARAKRCLDSLCSLILSRCRKGFDDRDPLSKNFGFIDDTAIEFDAGSFIPCPQERTASFCRQELIFATEDLRMWAEKNYQQAHLHLIARIQEESLSDE